eukprot:TRINITY_DN7996_c0_g1_i1.p1 TRINITY_DN7996_c0_g1~~TRINITY_DN7996_c0_g1_i1.p1  ORF type:complete len:314 (+),score=107.41 TRINITY_DN7996_c0_g1_i1:69-944(+)
MDSWAEWCEKLEGWWAGDEGRACADDDAAHDLSHVRRVVKAALELSGDAADRDVVVAAAYLHDVVNVPKGDPRRADASRLSAARAAEVLAALGFPERKLDLVRHAVAAHSFSAQIPCETREAEIVQDADRLDAVGAIGVLRCFYVSGCLGRACYDPVDPLAEGRALDDAAYALDHFPVKLFTLEGTMATAAGAAAAAARTVFLRGFRDGLAKDVRGGGGDADEAFRVRLARACCAAGAARGALFHPADPCGASGRALRPTEYALDAVAHDQSPAAQSFFSQLALEVPSVKA